MGALHSLENPSERISPSKAKELFEKDPLEVGGWADTIRRRIHGDRVYYRDDFNINYTNECYASCGFCAFYRKPGDREAYVYSLEEIERKARIASKMGVTEFHVVGGLTPKCDLEYIEKVLQTLKRVAPRAEIQGLTAVEVDFLASKEKISVREVLDRLQKAGLDSLPGGGAEIFHPEARRRMMATKISAERFLRVHEEAHRLGLPTNVSMLFGHVEKVEERIDHLQRIRDLQDKTGGFRAFVALRWNPHHTQLWRTQRAVGCSAWETLAVVSVARIFLDNVEHIKLPWVTVGKRLAQISLHFGVDDIGGSSFEERILDSAGAGTWSEVHRSDLPRLIREAGFVPIHAFGSYRLVPSPQNPGRAKA